ncbi:DUF2306 domain-containing protein [Devosia sp. SL43]|uniref:DUF2306 domain-containing protein n=1 Tax=Devosia sp. SL43 TaxID=2806348 RepID=UPI001F29AD65|nr:DUF2306 domain-containing protein [Devosia sp. SL43]UJW84808.1 DUF2306 domain-containing protein [Devosia sp. SL43]
MTRDHADWLIPAGLIGLALVPLANSALRLGALADGGPITPESARFFIAPAPIVLHIVVAMIFALLGAMQFSPGFRRRNINWHRRAGRVLVVCGALAALTGSWMALTYDFVPADGPIMHVFRLAFGPAMLATLIAGFLAVRQRNIPRHQAWMRRTYAIGMVVGTQTTILLPFQLAGQLDDLTRTVAISAAWILNLGTAEWLIRRQRPRRSTAARPA